MDFSQNPYKTPNYLPLLFLFLTFVSGDQNFNALSLNSAVKNSAFAVLSHRRTGILYNVPVPANFSGVAASMVRLRANGLWVGGAHFAGIRVPSRTLPEPFVKRMVIVYQNLANLSSHYYMVKDHTLVSPVLGLLVYNNTSTSGNSTNGPQEIDFKLTRGSIEITFPQLNLPFDTDHSSAKCVAFRRQNPPEFSKFRSTNSCFANGTGHFAVVIRTISIEPPQAGSKRRELWWVAVVVGGIGVILAVLLVMGVAGFVSRRRMVEMERKGVEDVTLGSVLVGGSKMPMAPMTRTKPVLENEIDTSP